MTVAPRRVAVLALHWQINVIKPEGFFGAMFGEPVAGEVVDNQKLSGLAGNDLPQRLAARGIDTVFLTGVATNLTVEQTARHGTDLGLTVHPVSDCVTAATAEIHAASLANLELATAGCLTADQVLKLLA
jgi:biuret amidohydrolase